MRPTFDLLTRAGWQHLVAFRDEPRAWRLAFADTWQHLKCLLLGHAFSDAGGKPWCERCHVVRRRDSD